MCVRVRAFDSNLCDEWPRLEFIINCVTQKPLLKNIGIEYKLFVDRMERAQFHAVSMLYPLRPTNRLAGEQSIGAVRLLHMRSAHEFIAFRIINQIAADRSR